MKKFDITRPLPFIIHSTTLRACLELAEGTGLRYLRHKFIIDYFFSVNPSALLRTASAFTCAMGICG